MEGQPPTTDHAAALRRVFLVRLAAWGAVLALAVIAFNVRGGTSDPEQGANGEQRDGLTSQGAGMWAVVDGKRVRELGMTWRVECDNGEELDTFSGTFHTSDLSHEGRTVRAEDERELPGEGDGWVAHVKTELTGELEPTGNLSGHSTAVVWFQRGVERGTVCRSGRVSWSIPVV